MSSGIQRQRSMLTTSRCSSEPNVGVGASTPLSAERVRPFRAPVGWMPLFS